MAGVLRATNIPVGHYEVMEEVFDDDFEPTQDGKSKGKSSRSGCLGN